MQKKNVRKIRICKKIGSKKRNKKLINLDLVKIKDKLRNVALLAAAAAGPKSAKDGCRAALANICGRFLKTDRHQELT